jgi:hypothetical protein
MCMYIDMHTHTQVVEVQVSDAVMPEQVYILTYLLEKERILETERETEREREKERQTDRQTDTTVV